VLSAFDEGPSQSTVYTSTFVIRVAFALFIFQKLKLLTFHTVVSLSKYIQFSVVRAGNAGDAESPSKHFRAKLVRFEQISLDLGEIWSKLR